MKNLRFLLAPFALIYGIMMWVRNLFFNIGFFNSKKYKILSIGIGNLSMGGTGKSILVEYLISSLKSKYNVATLSRGYGRSSKGFLIAKNNSSASEIGDEPFQFFKNHPEIKVVVCENRREGIQKIKESFPEIKLVIFDDLMQHRWVKSDVLIVTTSFKKPFFKDYLFPVGRLREFGSGIKRADIVLVTSTPLNLSDEEKASFSKKIRGFDSQPVFFTSLLYSNYISNFKEKKSLNVLESEPFLLVTGIADTTNILDYLNMNKYSFDHLEFPDHHNYSAQDCSTIFKKGGGKIILTTEKDYGRLAPKLNFSRLYYLPILLCFLNKKDNQLFKNLIKEKLYSS